MNEALVKGDSIIIGPCIQPFRPVLVEGAADISASVAGDLSAIYDLSLKVLDLSAIGHLTSSASARLG